MGIGQDTLLTKSPYLSNNSSPCKDFSCSIRRLSEANLGNHAIGRWVFCSCTCVQATGKRDAGLWSMIAHNLCGHVSEFEWDCQAAFECKLVTIGSDGRSQILSKSRDEDDLRDYWKTNVLDNPQSFLLAKDTYSENRAWQTLIVARALAYFTIWAMLSAFSEGGQ